MKKKSVFMINRPLADMHSDGVRFDPKIKEALINQRAGLTQGNQSRLKAE